MKQSKKGFLYICDNCDHQFYSKKMVRNKLTQCPRCGEKTASFDEYLQDKKKDYKKDSHKKLDMIAGFSGRSETRFDTNG